MFSKTKIFRGLRFCWEWTGPVIGVGIIILVLFATFGCQTATSPLEKDAILQPVGEITDANAEIVDRATAIKAETEQPAVAHHADVILDMTLIIAEQAEELKRINEQVNELASNYGSLERENEKLQQTIKDGERKMLLWLYGIGAFVIAAGIAFAIFANFKAGSCVIILGVVLVTVAHVLLNYAWLVYLGGGCVILGIIGWAIYRKAKLERKVLPQVFNTVEQLRGLIPDAQWKLIANATQDTPVQRVVEELLYREKRKRLR